MPRPTKLNAKLAQQICDYMAQGHTREVAALSDVVRPVDASTRRLHHGGLGVKNSPPWSL